MIDTIANNESCVSDATNNQVAFEVDISYNLNKNTHQKRKQLSPILKSRKDPC